MSDRIVNLSVSRRALMKGGALAAAAAASPCLPKLTELEQRKCSGLLNREEVWLLVEFLKIKFPLRFSIEKRELLVRGHPLRKLEEPSRYIRIPKGTHGGRRRLFRS